MIPVFIILHCHAGEDYWTEEIQPSAIASRRQMSAGSFLLMAGGHRVACDESLEEIDALIALAYEGEGGVLDPRSYDPPS